MAGALYSAEQSVQSVSAGGLIGLGRTVHKSCQSQISSDDGAMTLKGVGYFKITATVTFTGAAGNAILSLYKDGYQIPGAIVTETIATADTEYHTVTLSAMVAKTPCRLISSITLVNNSAIALSVSNVSASAERVA